MNKAVATKPMFEEIRRLFVVMSRQFGVLQKESSECCGVTTVQSHILYEIRRSHHLSLNELAEKLCLDSSTTSRHVHGLVEQGLVQRQPDPNDRRYVTLALTERGATLEKQIDEMMTACIADIFKQLSESEVQDVTSGLQLLTETMGKSDVCCKPML